jgi:hypothetical protein
MQSKKKAKKKVLRHILTNPFTAVMHELSGSETQALVSVLSQELGGKLTQHVTTDSGKRLKTDELSSMASVSRDFLILGINSLVASLDKVAVVVGLKCPETEVMLEPLAMLCRNSGVPFVTANYNAVKSKLREVTGVKLLAAFGVPRLHSLPLTHHLLSRVSPMTKGYVVPKIAVQEQKRPSEPV